MSKERRRVRALIFTGRVPSLARYALSLHELPFGTRMRFPDEKRRLIPLRTRKPESMSALACVRQPKSNPSSSDERSALFLRQRTGFHGVYELQICDG